MEQVLQNRSPLSRSATKAVRVVSLAEVATKEMVDLVVGGFHARSVEEEVEAAGRVVLVAMFA